MLIALPRDGLMPLSPLLIHQPLLDKVQMRLDRRTRARRITRLHRLVDRPVLIQQQIADAGVFAGRSVVIQMPTSAGKTRATEIIIRESYF
jgi:replicative superfamily II helicase